MKVYFFPIFIKNIMSQSKPTFLDGVLFISRTNYCECKKAYYLMQQHTSSYNGRRGDGGGEAIAHCSPPFLSKTQTQFQRKRATCQSVLQNFPCLKEQGNKCGKVGKGLQVQKVGMVWETQERWWAWSQGGDMAQANKTKQDNFNF